VVTISQLARDLGRNRILLGTLIRAHRIQTFRVPLNGRAKGLKPSGVRALKQALEDYDRQTTVVSS
jgi:hypothetical protein